MADEYTEALKKFEVPTPTKTLIVNTAIINTDVPAAARQALIDYHPKVDYEVTTQIVGTGNDAYLIVVPEGGAWNAEQQALLSLLKFVPTPDQPVAGRNRVLMILRDSSGNVRLASSHWYLVNARMEKNTIAGQELNDVILVWEYRAPAGQTPYFKPVLTSWKW